MNKITKTLLALLLFNIGVSSCSHVNSSEQVSSSSNSETSIIPTINVDKVENAKVYFILDVYEQEYITIDAHNYFVWDSEEVYFILKSKNNYVTVQKMDDTIFNVTAALKGNDTLELKAIANDKVISSSILAFNVIDNTPGAPIVSSTQFQYDKAVGGVCEIPIELNKGLPSLLKINDNRIPEENWEYDELTKSLVIDEEIMTLLGKDDYELNFITTGGNSLVTLKVYNSIITSFDTVTSKFGRNGYGNVSFDVNYSTATVDKVTYGDYTLTENIDYVVKPNTIEITENFYMRTCSNSLSKYNLYLSNNEVYEFSISNNQLFYSDYDVTTIHDPFESKTGINPLYQDSTTVKIVDAPDNVDLDGKVLKVTPYVGVASLSVYGIYTFADGGSSTWHKIPLVNNGKYTISFDYVTENTKANEDYRVRSWTGSLMGPSIITGQNGVKHHYSYTFTWKDGNEGIMLFGRFLNGGNIYIDNYSLVYEDYEVSANKEVKYLKGGGKTYDFSTTSQFSEFQFYSEIDRKGFFLNDRKLVSIGICESKALLNAEVGESYIVSADFSPLEDGCPLDAGFYFHATNANNRLDGISGYNLNLEKNGKDGQKVRVKIHKFEQGYMGQLKEVEYIAPKAIINVKLIVNKEKVEVYLDNTTIPVMEYTLSDYQPGTVGFRCFRGRGVMIDNFKIISPNFKTNVSSLESLIEKASAINKNLYVSSTIEKLEATLKKSTEIKTSEYQQKIDECQDEIQMALDSLLLKRTFAELQEKIKEANNITSQDKNIFTSNSYNCVVYALENASKQNENSNEYDISQAYLLLDTSIKGIIKY